jgi:nitrous oxidase accessory protein NosD
MKKTVETSFVILCLLPTVLLIGLACDIQTVKAGGTVYIRADGSVEGTNKIHRDGDVYTFTSNIYDKVVVQRSNITIDGNGYTLQGTGTGSGFDLSTVSGVTLRNAHITDFQYGVFIFYSAGATGPVPVSNVIIDNVISNCSWYAIFIFIADSTSPTHGHSIIGNTIINNGYGVALGHNTRSNTIYHNNFLNNTNQAYDSTDQTNWWNDEYPSGGNYWSDYEERYPAVEDVYSGPYQNETGSDGIWDHPYVIDANSQDNYPIIPEFPSLIIPALFIVVTLPAVIRYRRKHAV